jgi:hypothetical protein
MLKNVEASASVSPSVFGDLVGAPLFPFGVANVERLFKPAIPLAKFFC